MMHPTWRLVGMCVMAVALDLPAGAAVDPFQGAIALMDRGPMTPPPGSLPQREQGEIDYNRLVEMGAAFSKQAATLSPDEAAKQWLGLFDFFTKLPDNYRRRYISPVSSAGVFNYLPGPTTWPILQKLVEARAAKPPVNAKADAMLLFILHTLNNDETAQWADLAKMTAPGGVCEAEIYDVLPLGSELSKVAAQPAGAEAFWSRTLASLAARKVDLENSATVFLSLPDFVTLLGEAKAEALLTQALTLPGVRVNQVFGEATQALARKVALGPVNTNAELQQ